MRPPLRARVLALVGDGVEKDAPASYEDTIRSILAEGSTTMRTLAEYRALELGIDAAAITGCGRRSRRRWSRSAGVSSTARATF